MARTVPLEQHTGKRPARRSARRSAKKREQPLGAAIACGLAATLAAGIIIALALVLIPGTAAHQFYLLVHGVHSATLPLDPLFQEWSEKIQEEDALFGTPLSLLCGGLTLGRLAPSYVSRRRVLGWAGALGLAVPVLSLAFVWVFGVLNQNTLNHQQGGLQVLITAPPELVVRQMLWLVAWTAVCILGAWLGLRARQQALR